MTPDGHAPRTRVVFHLAVKDGWPPVSAEQVWAFELGDGLYRVDNAPWFARDIAVGDVVRAYAPDEQSHPVVHELVERSDHVTIRMICFRSGPLEGDLARALEPFAALGVYGEGSPAYGMLALDIESSAPLPEIVARLRLGAEDGSWQYEEGRITQAWVDATA